MKSNKKNPAELLVEKLSKDKPISDERELRHLAQMLMYRFLSEVEKVSDDRGISRKELAKKINVSPSYLTQVYRGNKPLNFLTLAKIECGLNMRFDVSAIDPEVLELDEWAAQSWADTNINRIVNNFNNGRGLWMFKSRKGFNESCGVDEAVNIYIEPSIDKIAV